MDNECVYDGKDDVRVVYEDKLKKADIIVFAQKLTRYSKMNVSQPETCLGVGAGKIFRDEIWGNLRFIFQADYRYYKNNGMMDFPQSKINTRIMHPFIPLMKLNPIKKQVQDRAKDMMHRSHDLIIKKEEDNLKENMDKLHRMADVLLERETITKPELDAIMKGEALPELPAQGAEEKAAQPEAKAEENEG